MPGMHLLAEAGSGLSPGPSGGLEGQEGGEQGWQPPGSRTKKSHLCHSQLFNTRQPAITAG